MSLVLKDGGIMAVLPRLGTCGRRSIVTPALLKTRATLFLDAPEEIANAPMYLTALG